MERELTKFLVKVEDERKKEEERETKEKQGEKEDHALSQQNKGRKAEDEKEREEDMLSLGKVPCFQQKAFPVFVEGAGSTIVVMVSPQVGLEDFVRPVQTN